MNLNIFFFSYIYKRFFIFFSQSQQTVTVTGRVTEGVEQDNLIFSKLSILFN